MISIFSPLMVEPHSRRLVRRDFAVAVQRQVLAEMPKRSETDAPELKPLRDAGADATVMALKELITELLPDRRPTIQRVARRLGTSARTLQRRLREWGHSFEDIVDDTRRDIAIKNLTAHETSISETAFLLGYSDLSHFTRAFRRWTGTTPREFTAAKRRREFENP